MAGGAWAVVISSLSGPSKQIFARSYPSTPLARSNHSLAAADFSAKSFPIPTVWAPWPANNKAALFMTLVRKLNQKLRPTKGPIAHGNSRSEIGSDMVGFAVKFRELP